MFSGFLRVWLHHEGSFWSNETVSIHDLVHDAHDSLAFVVWVLVYDASPSSYDPPLQPFP